MSRKGTKLPGVGESRARLDYGDLSLQRTKFFHEDCRFFIRHYVDAEGNAGSEFTDRNSRDHLDGIEIMTEAFLEAYGDFWWPSDHAHRNANRLQYSTSKQHITDTLKLLFLRINIQCRSNSRYKKKNGAHSAREPAARSDCGPKKDQSAMGSSVNDPIDLENVHNQARPAQDRADGTGNGFQSVQNTPDHAAPTETQPKQHQQETRETDPHKVPKTPDPLGQSNSTQGSHARARVAQSTSASTRDATTGDNPAAFSGTKRATTETTQHSSKRPKVNITTRRASNYRPERTSQRKSSRKRSFIYDSLDFTGEGHSPLGNAHPLAAVAETVAEEVAPSQAAQGARETEQEAVPSSLPATATQNPAGSEVSHVPDTAPADASDNAQPAPLTEQIPTQPEVTGSGEEPNFQAGLERAIKLTLATRGKASEALAETSVPNPDANARFSAIEAFLFSRINALSTSGTPKESSAQVLEHLAHTSRVPEAPMGLVHNTGLQFLAVEHRKSPPPPEMGEDEWNETANVPLRRTEFVKEAKEATEAAEAATAANGTEAALISTMSAEVGSSRVTLERSTTQTRAEHSLTAKSPAAEAPENQESTARESEKFSAAPPLHPAAAHSELRLFVTGPRLHEEWKGAPPLSDLTMARIKTEIPLQLSPEFRGFKFTLRGPERRHRFEILDGDEQEFVHLKFDVEEVMEDMEEQNQSKSVYLGFQLRIEELRDTHVKEDRANS